MWIPLDIALTVVFGFYFLAYWYYEEYICEEDEETENTPGPHKHMHHSGYTGTQMSEIKMRLINQDPQDTKFDDNSYLESQISKGEQSSA